MANNEEVYKRIFLISSRSSDMKKLKKIIFTVFLLLVAALASTAQLPPAPLASPVQMGAYLPGLINPRDYANPGTSGLMALDYNLFFSSNEYIDRHGNKVDNLDLGLGFEPIPIDLDMSGYINALVIAYVSPELNFLGNARYMAILSPYYATADYRVGLGELVDSTLVVDGGASGFGDLGITPLYLTWSLGEDKFDITTAYMFTAPTARYETGADDNIGLGYWNHAFQLFTYYYLLEKATAIFLGNTFEFHGKVKDVDVTPGSRHTIEYGVSQYLSERFEVTIQGSHSWQIGEDSGTDVYWDTSYKDKSSTIGAGLGYWPVKEIFYANFKWWTNYNLRQHFKANSYQIQLIYIPGILMSKADKK
jgi:hypothetical protein